MSELGELLADAAQRILTDHVEATRSRGDASGLWAALEGAGFAHALVPEEQNGAGMGWSDAFALWLALGAHAAPVPLAETMIANRLLAAAGLPVAQGMVALAGGAVAGSRGSGLSLVPHCGGLRISGRLTRVPWARGAVGLVVVCDRPHGPQLLWLDAALWRHRVTPGHNLAGEPRDTIELEDVTATAIGPSIFDSIALQAVGAVARSTQMAGALQSVQALAVDYANLRVQFGRPIAKFQAIQHALAQLASHTAAACAAAAAAVEALDAAQTTTPFLPTDALAVASAKICCGEAAGLGAAIAHQSFGAIGFTEEHSLHVFTKRLWSWRDEFGSEASWSRAIGERFCAAGSDALWPAVVDARVPATLAS